MSKPKYRCQECGHEFRSKQDYPQCSDPNDECGRSRNVEQIDDPAEGTGSEGGASPDPETNPPHGKRADDDTDAESDAESEAWTPLFDVDNVEREPPDTTGEIPIESEDESLGETGEEPADFGDVADTPPALEGEDIEPIIDATFDSIAARKGEHWELSDSEAERMANAYANLGEKYMPYLLSEHSVEITAVIVTATIVMPRIQEDMADDEDEEPDTESVNDMVSPGGEEPEESEQDSPARRGSESNLAISRV